MFHIEPDLFDSAQTPEQQEVASLRSALFKANEARMQRWQQSATEIKTLSAEVRALKDRIIRQAASATGQIHPEIKTFAFSAATMLADAYVRWTCGGVWMNQALYDLIKSAEGLGLLKEDTVTLLKKTGHYE